MTARFILLALASCCALVVLAQKPAEVRPDSISTSKSWTPREPLSPEEQERRAAKEAELEAMRARFRRYQRSATAKTAADSITRAQGDYLWSDAETPRTEAAAIDTIRPLEPQRMDAEALRREIGRNLQVKGALNTPSVDEPPAAYDSPSFRLPQSDWESKWQVDKKRTPPAATNNTDWARDLGQEEPIAQKTGDYRAGWTAACT
ncbi:MAG: hypothetical protein D6772_09635 [Bacteroidetes bacterium]|nr:MAG: hypothetical protein D6772_09635 [Bacteroidota bacterium]